MRYPHMHLLSLNFSALTITSRELLEDDVGRHSRSGLIRKQIENLLVGNQWFEFAIQRVLAAFWS